MLVEQLGSRGLACCVRTRALGFLVTFDAEGGEGAFELRTLRATDLVRALGPRLASAPAALQRALRATVVAYVVPEGLDAAWHQALVDVLVEAGEGVPHDTSGWRAPTP